MSALQRRIIEFLNAELVHSLGSFRVARDRLATLQSALDQDYRDTKKPSDFLRALSDDMRQLNHELSEIVSGRDLVSGDVRTRQAVPSSFPFSLPLVDGSPSHRQDRMTWVDAYYGAVECGLEDWAKAVAEAEAPNEEGPNEKDVFTVLRGAVALRDDVANASAGRRTSGSRPRRMVQRAERMKHRREHAWHEGMIARLQREQDDRPAKGKSHLRASAAAPGGETLGPADELVNGSLLAVIEASHLDTHSHGTLPKFVLEALVDGHLLLHLVEAQRSRPIKGKLDALVKTDDRRCTVALQRSIALNTFAWTVSRSAPWIFAEDEIERARIASGFAQSWRHCRPMRAMWIGTQVMLLALYRRSHALMLLGDYEASYQDLHKLQATIREVARRQRQSTMQVESASGFLDTLDALADFRIGMLYRSAGDQRSTLKFLRRSQNKLVRLKGGTGSEQAVVNSRWVVKLQLALGKSSYHLGQHKAALRWYLLSWRSLLEHLSEAAGGRLSLDTLDSAIEWLTLLVDDPELHKLDLIAELAPAVAQIEAVRVDELYRGIAAEIMLRLGHLLFILDLGRPPSDDESQHDLDSPSSSNLDKATEPPKLDAPGIPDLLALRLLRRAYVLDPANTLASSNLMRAALRARERDGVPERIADATERICGENGVPAERQWPGGRNEAEALSHLLDASLLQLLWDVDARPRAIASAEDDKARDNRDIARALLADVLQHTDSIEARKGQVFASLEKQPSTVKATQKDKPGLEFICLRRYSSAFPILPRPRGFRSDGGGYFVRVHPGGTRGRAFGIAVDPGTGYIDCLYREGLSVADIDMILVTHDHVDHASALEPLLAVRHEARQSGGYIPERIWVLCNRSVHDRMHAIFQYARPSRERQDRRDVTFVDLSKHQSVNEVIGEVNERLRRGVEDASNCSLALTPLPSTFEDEGDRVVGHRDAGGHPSIGLLIQLHVEGSSQSIAIGGDLPGIPEDASWSKAWSEALAADVLVAHLSTVPMTELRKLAQLEPGSPRSSRAADDEKWLNGAVKTTTKLNDRFAYALWLHGGGEPMVDVGPLESGTRLQQWQPWPIHPYLQGIINLARAFKTAPGAPSGRLFIIGELSEELGSVRTKVATRLNETIFAGTNDLACTSDIGMRTVVTAAEQDRVLTECSTCALDYDRSLSERLHPARSVTEFCVKGENEGVFYSCPDHRPDGTAADPRFIERHERFDLFGR